MGTKELPDFIQLGEQIQVRLAENKNHLVRFTALPIDVVEKDGTCKTGCTCHSVAPNLCVLQHGCTDVHDSSFYMMTNSMFNEFIATDGIIDMEIFGGFDSVMVTPPIT